MVPTTERIVVLDFGSQYSQLIARRVREAEVFCELLPWNVSKARIAESNPRGIIISGGPASVYEEGAPTIQPWLLALGVPVLGICYGAQLLTILHQGRVERAPVREYGPENIELLEPQDPLLAGTKQAGRVWMSHGDSIIDLPAPARVIARSHNKIPAVVCFRQNVYGVQFHPEVSHTEEGRLFISNFVHNVCGCSRSWNAKNFVDAATEDIRRQVGSDIVIGGVSGGIDSAVAAGLAQRAIGANLHCFLIDNGLMRQGEADECIEALAEAGLKVKKVDAAAEFLKALAGVSDPEDKRKTIGRVFAEVFEREARAHPTAKFLLQGTLYPDVIESAGRGESEETIAANIKTHHNVGGLPKKLGLKVLEPQRLLFKDEVRRAGQALGLPATLVGRHPFPGPGLAVRIIGEVTAEKLTMLRKADRIFVSELRDAGLYNKVGQALAVLTSTRSVGVMGDSRTYGHVVALRCVDTEDWMTADWSRLPTDLLAKVSRRIVNEVDGVNRVVFDITSKPPATVEWE